MELPFIFIEDKITSRKEFDIVKGYQPTYALFYLKEGSFLLQMGNTDSIVHKGDFCIFPDNIEFYRTVIQPISFIYLKFRINEKSKFTFPLPMGKINITNKERLLDNIMTYELLSQNTQPRAIYLRRHILQDILLTVFYEYNKNLLQDFKNGDFNITFTNDPVLSNAMRYIRQSLNKKNIR